MEPLLSIGLDGADISKLSDDVELTMGGLCMLYGPYIVLCKHSNVVFR